jgi:hypothetical protein
MASYPIRAKWFGWGAFASQPVPVTGTTEAQFLADLPPLVPGVRTTAIHATIPAGSVISTSPTGSQPPGTAIDYVVSTGPVTRSKKSKSDD